MTLTQDVLLGKLGIIRNRVSSINRVTSNGDLSKLSDFSVQDVVILNLQRAIQACIDMAHHLTSAKKFGVPINYGHSFSILSKNSVISSEMSETMRRMVAFRNISVHEYQEIDPKIVELIVAKHLSDFETYALQIIKFASL